MRSTRPAAIASLPSLLANAQGEPTYTQANRNGHGNGVRGQMRNGNGHAGGHANGHVAMPQTAVPLPVPVVEDGSQPILPPHPTGRMMTAAPSESSWLARNWPLLVIAMACLAILVALFFMIFPFGKANSADEGTKGGKVLAPERMDTDPLVPKTDPWGKGGTQPDKPNIDIPDDPDVDDPDVDDPGSAGGPTTTLQGTGAIMMGMIQHACDRAKSCGPIDARLEEYCEETKKWPIAPPPASCPAAQRCFKHIDQMSCSQSFDDISALTSVTHKFEDCVEALTCS